MVITQPRRTTWAVRLGPVISEQERLRCSGRLFSSRLGVRRLGDNFVLLLDCDLGTDRSRVHH